MSSRVVDLTGDSSDIEPEIVSRKASAATSRPHTTRESQQNGRQSNAMPGQKTSAALKDAILSMDSTRLKKLVVECCETISELRQSLEQQLLVKGKTVDRYHIDSDSEDRENSDNSEDNDTDIFVATEVLKRELKEQRMQRPIEIADEDFTSRYAKCENCKQEFEVCDNERRECHWHTGKRELYYEDDFWADHDPDCHGDPEQFEDDPDFADGFRWNCCETPGDDKGCKHTRHRAPVNVVQTDGLNKRKATEELQRPVVQSVRLV